MTRIFTHRPGLDPSGPYIPKTSETARNTHTHC
eukprot:CAMPEP_0119199218 /NCGR_PEP_ID=MMETSP1316-20130426/21999_1 /TAXON_ID=41880 /ORGANISM="Pycnococcus provasolii, Strain RCC2336" /LENGTH=32 /DNA_ID= /DNA_START= /DNA_END= /DNA_ORIENTATION=